MMLLDVPNLFAGVRRRRICSALRTVIGQDRSEMPSQRAAALFSGGLVLKNWSTGQTIAWSSGEAKLHALNKMARADVGTYFHGCRFGEGYQGQGPYRFHSSAYKGVPVRLGPNATCFCSSTYGSNRKCLTRTWLLKWWTRRRSLLTPRRRVCLPNSQRILWRRAEGRSNLTQEIALITRDEAILTTAQFLKRHCLWWGDRIFDLP